MTIEFTAEIEQLILTDLENGISLVKICETPGMPSRSTVLRWQREFPDFDAKCAHAREAQGDLAVDKLDEINEKVESGTLKADAANVMSSNLKWKAAKLKPKKYGDSTQIKLADADGNKLSFTGILQELDGRTTGLPETEDQS